MFLYSDVLCFSYEKNSKIGIYNTFSKKFQATRGDNQQAKKHINDLLSGNLPLQDVQKTLPTKKKYELPGSIYNADAIKSPIKLCYIEEEKAWKKREKNVFIAVNKADYFDAEDIKIGHAIRKQKGTLFFYKNDCYFRYESNNQKMLWNNNQKEENARFAKFAFHSEKFKPVNKEEYLKLERYFEQLLDKNFVKKEEEKEKDHHSINKKEQIKSSDDEYKEKNTLDNEEMYNSEQYNKLKDQLKKQGETLFQIGKKIQAFLNRLSTSNKTKEKEEEIKKFIAETNQAILASKIKENQGPGDINIKQKKPSEWSVDQCISFIQQTNLTKEEILKEFEMSFNNKDLNVKELTFKEVNSFLEEEEFDIKDHLQDIQDGIMEINSDVFNKKDDFKNELCRKDFNKIIKYVAEKLCKELNPLSYKPTPHI